MPSEIRFSRLPKTDGKSQEREVRVVVVADEDYDTSEQASVVLSIDGDRDGSFNELASGSDFIRDGNEEFVFTTLISAQTPYDLRATATVPLENDDEQTVSVTTTVQTEPAEPAEQRTTPTTAASLTNSGENVTPSIGDVVPVTMKTDYQLPWDRQSNQTACGTTLQYNAGDLNWRIVVEGIITINQLRDLENLRGRDKVTLNTAEFGKKQIVPDQLNVTRADKEEVGDIQGTYGPLLSFQLQTKELNNDSGLQFFNQ